MVRRASLLVTLGLMGCGHAAPPVVYPAPQPLTVAAPAAEVWRAAIDLATEMALPIGILDAGSGYLRTDAAYLPEPAFETWWDCSVSAPVEGASRMLEWERAMLEKNAPRRDTTRVTPGLAPLGRVTLTLLEHAGKTRLRLLVSDLTYPPTRGKCRSKGVFEGYFLSAVVERWRVLYRVPERP